MAAARAIALAALCLGLACGKGDSAPKPEPAAGAPAVGGRIDPGPYRAQIEATEALLYGEPLGDQGWRSLSKALLDLHNEIVFRDTSPPARETSRRLFFFSAQVDAAASGRHADEQLQAMRVVWEKIRADQFAAADWFHPAPK